MHGPLPYFAVSEYDSNNLTGLAAKKFGHVQLKDWQEKVLGAVLQGQHAVVAQPTGSGKSLCYQLPPFVTGGFTLVVTPTLSLIHDQVKHLEDNDIPATFMCSTQQDHTVGSGIQAGEYKVVYVMPERLFPGGGPPDPWFLSLAVKGKICLLAIDEAHCMFTWQSFR